MPAFVLCYPTNPFRGSSRNQGKSVLPALLELRYSSAIAANNRATTKVSTVWLLEDVIVIQSTFWNSWSRSVNFLHFEPTFPKTLTWYFLDHVCRNIGVSWPSCIYLPISSRTVSNRILRIMIRLISYSYLCVGLLNRWMPSVIVRVVFRLLKAYQTLSHTSLVYYLFPRIFVAASHKFAHILLPL